MPAEVKRPGSVLLIEILGYVGVIFWISRILAAAVSGEDFFPVLLVGIVLGSAHVIIAVGARRHSPWAFGAMWFVLAGDTVLALVVNPAAWVLVGFTIILLLLTRLSSARQWWARSGQDR